MIFRIFGLSIAITIASRVVAFIYGGPTALFLTLILGILEVSLSFDNAVINATVLRRMSAFWQKIFLTIGVLIAVFGMRLVFPLVIVWLSAKLNPVEALRLALNPPTDGSPTYEQIITDAHPQIAAFGGMFLMLLFLGFIFEEREHTWLSWIEKPLAKAGKLDMLPVVVAGVSLVLAAEFLAEDEKISTVMVSGVLGMVTYITVDGLSSLFMAEPESDGPESDGPGSHRSGSNGSGPHPVTVATGSSASPSGLRMRRPSRARSARGSMWMDSGGVSACMSRVWRSNRSVRSGASGLSAARVGSGWSVMAVSGVPRDC